MTWWKNGLLLAAGGAVGLVAGVLLCETDFEDEQDGQDATQSKEDAVQALVARVRCEAIAAMEECETDEEREAVYAQVRQSIQETQEMLAKKGNELIAELQKQEEAIVEDSKTPEKHVQNIKDTLQELTNSLDETLVSLKPNVPVAVM